MMVDKQINAGLLNLERIETFCKLQESGEKYESMN